MNAVEQVARLRCKYAGLTRLQARLASVKSHMEIDQAVLRAVADELPTYNLEARQLDAIIAGMQALLTQFEADDKALAASVAGTKRRLMGKTA